MNTAKPLLSIAQYVELLNEQLSAVQANVIGEITQIKTSAKGHVYFTLKDKDQEAVLECVLWKSRYTLYGISLEVGMEIIVNGTTNIYAPWGKLNFIAETIELVGEGALKKKYDQLKKKLFLEGLFAEERKKKLPDFPRKIGVITSRQGAVIHDFMNNLGRYGFQITFIDSHVEGAEALPDLYNAMETLKRKDLDVIVIMRGGGSIQSLAAFDAEVLVRAIAKSQIPIIAAIGHHQDVPLSALTADISVSSPTAATVLLNSSWDRAYQLINTVSQKIFYGHNEILNFANQTILSKQLEILSKFNRIFDTFSFATSQVPSYLLQISSSLESNTKEITHNTQKIIKIFYRAINKNKLELNNFSKTKLLSSFTLSLKSVKDKLETQKLILNANDPLRQLSLGYSLVKNNNNRLVKSIKNVTIGERLNILTQGGTIDSEVKALKKEKHDKTN